MEEVDEANKFSQEAGGWVLGLARRGCELYGALSSFNWCVYLCEEKKIEVKWGCLPKCSQGAIV